jgi:hypothetical protein
LPEVFDTLQIACYRIFDLSHMRNYRQPPPDDFRKIVFYIISQIGQV